ncbi:MAG TPA: enoyl-CoA hydratase-related protein [Acidimicrobiales bacterium]|nr:enoyl-CoA hydratase-related protein [Acidimicrobiales bacterium]
MSEFVKVERRDDGVAVLRLDRPKANALSAQVLAEIEAAAAQLHDDPPGAVVVWGGERIFAAGADIVEFTKGGGGAEAGVVDGPDAVAIAHNFRRALDAVAAIPRAVIAAVNGYALGGGCELALACDFRVAADNARFGQPEILLGIIPGGGGTQRLARLVGASRAKEIILSGRQVDAEEAHRIGLADRVVPAASVLDEAVAWAAELAKGPVVAHGLAKRAIDAGLDRPLSEGLELEGQLFGDVFATEDAATGVRSFLESGPGKATFSGR